MLSTGKPILYCRVLERCIVVFRPRLHYTGATSAPEQKVLWFNCIYTAPVQKLYQIALPFTLYQSPLSIQSKYCALLKNKNAITCPDDLTFQLFAPSFPDSPSDYIKLFSIVKDQKYNQLRDQK